MSLFSLPWDIRPPNSVTIPDIIGKYGDQPISVLYVIKTSPTIQWLIFTNHTTYTYTFVSTK